MYDLLIIGAGPGGIALAAEAKALGHDPAKVLILEKGVAHNWRSANTIRPIRRTIKVIGPV